MIFSWVVEFDGEKAFSLINSEKEGYITIATRDKTIAEKLNFEQGESFISNGFYSKLVPESDVKKLYNPDYHSCLMYKGVLFFYSYPSQDEIKLNTTDYFIAKELGFDGKNDDYYKYVQESDVSFIKDMNVGTQIIGVWHLPMTKSVWVPMLIVEDGDAGTSTEHNGEYLLMSRAKELPQRYGFDCINKPIWTKIVPKSEVIILDNLRKNMVFWKDSSYTLLEEFKDDYKIGTSFPEYASSLGFGPYATYELGKVLAKEIDSNNHDMDLLDVIPGKKTVFLHGDLFIYLEQEVGFRNKELTRLIYTNIDYHSLFELFSIEGKREYVKWVPKSEVKVYGEDSFLIIE